MNSTTNTNTTTCLDAPTTSAPIASSVPSGRGRHKRHRMVRRVAVAILSLLGALLLIAAAVAFWALDRYVIDHVEIADVAAHEAVAEDITGIEETADPMAGASSGNAAESVDQPDEAITTATSFQNHVTSIEISTVVTGSGRDTVTYPPVPKR